MPLILAAQSKSNGGNFLRTQKVSWAWQMPS